MPKLSLVWIGLSLLLLPCAALAQDAERPNTVSVQAGGQVNFNAYRTGVKLNVGYARWLSGLLWLDFDTGAVLHKDTNWNINGGVRWKFAPTASGVRAHVRADIEVAFLFEGDTETVVGIRGGGGAGYYWTPLFGMTLEGTVALGPAFGQDGVRVASSMDLLVGADFVF